MTIRSLKTRQLAPWSALFAGLVLSTPFPGRAEDFARGQELYDHHCQSCHEDLMHARNRKLKTLDALRGRIRDWASHTGNPWTDEDIDDVLYYLNKSFYRFDQKAL
jgi:mono/diheme cytochrome c family protein